MSVTKDGFKDRQLHIEDYLQMLSVEQKEYAEVSVYQRTALPERKPEQNNPGCMGGEIQVQFSP